MNKVLQYNQTIKDRYKDVVVKLIEDTKDEYVFVGKMEDGTDILSIVLKIDSLTRFKHDTEYKLMKINWWSTNESKNRKWVASHYAKLAWL